MNAAGRATALVLTWARRYTRGLDDEVRERRLAELASDCFEHRRWGDEVGASSATVAAGMVARTVAGVPADLLWRQGQLATSRDRSPHPRGRPMGRWMKDNWWLVLAAATGALLVVMGVLLPFEDRTRGALVGGIVIAGLGGLMLAGIGVRRRRRLRGDVMIAVGTLPLFPFVWTIVFPVLGLVIGIAALRDATDGRLVDHTEGPRRDRPASGDGTTRVLLGVVLVAVVAAIAIGEQDVAVVLVGPPLALLIAYLLLLPVRVAPLVRWGLTLLLTGVVHGLPMTAVLVWGDADAGFADRALPVSMSIVGAGGVLGLVLLVVGLARSRGRTRPV